LPTRPAASSPRSLPDALPIWVVNGSPQVSESARAAVIRAIEELGYVPNRAARALVTQRTDSVALVVSESEERVFAEPFFAGIIRDRKSTRLNSSHVKISYAVF